MPDLLASTSLLPLTPAIAPRTLTVAAPAVADFMAMLGELVLPPGAKPQGGKGQGLAGDGKGLPVDGAPAAAEDETDPLVAWLPAGLLPLAPPEPVSLPDAAFVAAAPPPGVEGAVVITPVADAPLSGAIEIHAALADGTLSTPVADAVSVVAVAADSPIVDPALVDAEISQASAAPETGLNGKAETPVREALLRAAPAQTPTIQPVIPGATTAPTAAQVFAAAISASFDTPAGPALRPTDPVAAQVHAAGEQLRTTVQAMSGTEQPPLDLSRGDWAGKMVDRIAAMRDAAEAADTRIRLAPENLGNVDISIRRDGDRLHVHFSAENPAARQLLAEGAPRLAELAEARGVKLGQTSVDGGTGGQQQGAPNQSQSNQPARPASAMADQLLSDRDDRVA